MALHAYNSPNNNDHNHASILNDPQWLAIMQIGKVMKKNLIFHLDENEKEILTEDIYNAYFKKK